MGTAQFFAERFDYTLPHALQIEFIRELERPNDYKQHVMYLSLYRGEQEFLGEKWQFLGAASDPTVLAHEFAHFVFWHRLGSQLKGTSSHVAPKLSRQEFHAVQEGWCDFMSASVTGDTIIGHYSTRPPLRDLNDWDFRKHRSMSIPQFQGWGNFLWMLYTQHSKDHNIDFKRVVFESVKHLDRGAGFQAFIEAMAKACHVVYSVDSCTELLEGVHTTFQDRYLAGR